MPSHETSNRTIVLAYTDAENIGDWFFGASMFLSDNYDVNMFDCRGFGASMGSIVATEYARQHSVDHLIFDSSVLFPQLATQLIKEVNGNEITSPKTLINDRTINAQTLILVDSDNFLCNADDMKN